MLIYSNLGLTLIETNLLHIQISHKILFNIKIIRNLRKINFKNTSIAINLIPYELSNKVVSQYDKIWACCVINSKTFNYYKYFNVEFNAFAYPFVEQIQKYSVFSIDIFLNDKTLKFSYKPRDILIIQRILEIYSKEIEERGGSYTMRLGNKLFKEINDENQIEIFKSMSECTHGIFETSIPINFIVVYPSINENPIFKI